MKRLVSSLLLIGLALGLMAFQAAPVGTQATCTQVVIGQSCLLPAGQRLSDGMLVLGGQAMLEEGSVVEGDVVVLGGTLQADGRIEGDLNLAGGTANLGSQAVVEGDVNSAGGTLNRQDGARVEGAVNLNVPSPFMLPGRIQTPNWSGRMSPASPWAEPISAGLGLVWEGMWWLVRSVLWALVALLVALMLPERTRRVSMAAVSRPVEAGGMGCLTQIVGVIVLVVLTVTICGIPFALLGALVLAAAWALGVVAIGSELGKRLVGLTHFDMAPAVTAALGTFVLTLVTNGISAVIPCIGWLAPALVGAVGIGAVLITRFGGEPPAARSGMVVAPVHPAAPVVPYDVTGSAVPAAEAAVIVPEAPMAAAEEPAIAVPYDVADPAPLDASPQDGAAQDGAAHPGAAHPGGASTGAAEVYTPAPPPPIGDLPDPRPDPKV